MAWRNESQLLHSTLPSPHPFYYQAVDAEAAEASVGALRYRLDGKHAQEEVHTLIRRTQNAHHTAKHSAAHRAPITLTTLRTLLSTPHTAMPFTLSDTHRSAVPCACALALLLLHRCCATT